MSRPGGTTATGSARGDRPRVVVVGGGISGLVAAWDLARGGADVVLLEATDRPGGPLLTGAVGGVTVDLGAESFLTRRPEVTTLVAELGAAGDVVAPETATATILRDGTPHPLPTRTVLGVPADPPTLAPLLTPDEVSRVEAEVPQPLDGDVSVADLVATRVGPAVVDHVVDPLLGGVYAGRAAALSAETTLPQLTAAVREGLTLRQAAAGVLDRAAATAGAPPFAGLVGGVGRLPELLVAAARAAGVDVQTSVAVTDLRRAGRTGWTVTTTGRGVTTLDADGVVLAAPGPVTGRLLATVRPDAAGALTRLDRADVAVVALALRADDVPGLAAGSASGVLVPAVEAARLGLAVKAVTYSSAKWAWVAEQDPGTVVVRASVGRAGAGDAPDPSDARLVERVVTDVGRLLAAAAAGPPAAAVPPAPGDARVPPPGGPAARLDPLDVHVQRWPASLPQYPVGHSRAVAGLDAALAAERGLAVAGSALDGVGLPACVATGRRAAASLLADLELARLRGRADPPTRRPSPAAAG